jgi:hypothetical protein
VDRFDRNWMTTDQCVTLDVAFQFTVEGGQNHDRNFISVSASVNASDGTADVRVPVAFEKASQAVGVQVTGVSFRACDAKPSSTNLPGISCEEASQARVRLLAASRQVMVKQLEMQQGLADLEQTRKEMHDDTWLVTSASYATLVHLNSLGAAARVGLAATALLVEGVTAEAVALGAEADAIDLSGADAGTRRCMRIVREVGRLSAGSLRIG